MNEIKDVNALSCALEISLKRHEEELKRVEVLHGKANTLIGYTTALGGLYFGFVSSKPLAGNTFLSMMSFFVFLIATIVIILCLYANNSLLVKWFATGPGGKIMIKKAKELTEIEFKSEMLESYATVYSTNYKQNLKSSNTIQLASILFTLGCFIGLLGFLSQITK